MIQRRHFLRFAGTTLASLGINQLMLRQQSTRYSTALAQPVQRKRALLVGINQYSQTLPALRGCVTDVELQRELLIHRFGFTDVLTLKDTEATRDNIIAAFEDFLIGGCEAGDVAVFHFSGHGRRIADPNPTRVASGERDPLVSTLVPYQNAESGSEIPDIMGSSLFLLTHRLKTENVTVVLDSCYAEGGIRGSTRVRSGGRQPSLQASVAERDWQEYWRAEQGLSADEFQTLRDTSIAKGIALAAARRNQAAVDVTFGTTTTGESFDAGAFTYFLTQYLWHEIEPVNRVIVNVSRNLADDTFSQNPSVCVAPFECRADTIQATDLAAYFVAPTETERVPSAEGVILSVSEKRGNVWFGGSDRYSLETYGNGASFVAIAPDGSVIQENITVQSRNGLKAEVILSELLPAGTLLQESSRVIPRDYALRVGLDPSVMDEQTAIQSTLGTIRRLELVPFQSEAQPYSGEIHYIMSRMTADYLDLLEENFGTGILATARPSENSLVIVSQGLNEVIPNSWGEAGESIEEASDRLSAKLNALIAARLVKLLINANAAQLDIRVRMDVLGGRSQLAQQFTVRGTQAAQSTTPGGLLEVPVGRSLQFSVIHQEPEPLYLLVLIVDRTGDIFSVFPSQFLGITPEDTKIEPNRTKQIPALGTAPLNVVEPGFGEVLVIASRSPLVQAMRALRGERTATTPAIDALVGDLSRVSIDARSGMSQELRIKSADIAALSIPFRAV